MNIPCNTRTPLVTVTQVAHRQFLILWLTLGIILCSLVLINPAWANPNEKTKWFQQVSNYTKTVPLNSRQKVEIDNQYGSVVVKTWDNASVKVDIQIKSSSLNKEVAQKAINRVKISETNNAQSVKFRTEIKNTGSGFFTQNRDELLEIHYTVYLPSKQALAIRMAYGDVVLPTYAGHVELNVSYGTIKTGDLPSKSSILAKYSTVRLGKLGETQLNVRYGKLTLAGAKEMQLNTSYTNPVQLGHLQNEFSLQLAYCSGVNFEIGRNIRQAVVNAQYSHVSAEVDRSANFQLLATIRYGNHSIKGININDLQQNKSSSASSISGQIGKSSKEKVNFNISYGNLKLSAH